jgi:hypothetical protein
MGEDEYQVQRTITAYSLLTGRGDWDPVLALFVPDGVWEIPHLSLRFAGHEALRGAFAMLTEDLDFVLQQNGPALIDVAGDEATARSNIREAGKRKGRDEGFEFFGTYADTLVRTPAGWKFARRVFEHVGTQFWPLVPAA